MSTDLGVRRFMWRSSVAFWVATAFVCLLLHVATFLTTIPVFWVLIPFALLSAAVLCTKAAGHQLQSAPLEKHTGRVVIALFVYAVLTFVYFYRTTGGASSVEILDGQYVAKYKDRVIAVITEQEYLMYPNLWTRVMSAWMGAMAAIGLTSGTR